MTRYFYTDPLAAVWMAKHFGMRFVEEWAITANDFGITFGGVDRFHIHPDSAALLEPRAGDFARDNFVLIQVVGDDEADEWPLFSAAEAAAMKAARRPGAFEVIQRDGVVFHWPDFTE